MDFVSWDNYPNAGEPEAMIAMKHDLMRGIKARYAVSLMEQTPSVSNWHNYATLKRPGRNAPDELSGNGARRGYDYVLSDEAVQSGV
jgi:beta-galactosidase GanA